MGVGELCVGMYGWLCAFVRVHMRACIRVFKRVVVSGREELPWGIDHMCSAGEVALVVARRTVG